MHSSSDQCVCVWCKAKRARDIPDAVAPARAQQGFSSGPALPWCRAKGTAPKGSCSGQAVPAHTDDTSVTEQDRALLRQSSPVLHSALLLSSLPSASILAEY